MMMWNKSAPRIQKDVKILVTVGPASLDRAKIQAMARDGVDVFRINLSHTRFEDLQGVVEKLRSWTDKAICLDSEGAQVRTGRMKDGSVNYPDNSIVSLASYVEIGDEFTIPLYPIDPAKVLRVGDMLHLDFHSVVIQVTEVVRDRVHARVLAGGRVGSNKGVSIDRDVELDPFTEKDRQCLALGARMGIRHVALSFAGHPDHVASLRKLFDAPITVISKIESREGLRNLQPILKASDAILIDRGDLSRDVPVEKIGIAQQYIMKVAAEESKPVYVATNLLETMITSVQPSRAEINDVTSTLLSGASGLVLAAETAIGKYPVEAVRMISKVIRQLRGFDVEMGREETIKALGAGLDYGLVEPHGGKLVENRLEQVDPRELEGLPSLRLDEKAELDFFQIVDGVYSPIRGFMGLEELNSVLDRNRLLDGTVWTLPILLQVKDSERKTAFQKGQRLVVRSNEGDEVLGVMDVQACERIDLESVAQRWYGTQDKAHPGVAALFAQGEYILSGEVFAFGHRSRSQSPYVLTPKQTRRIFRDFGWRTVVGFHTRNVIHRGHELVQQRALRDVSADALFVSPVIGPKKKGDFTGETVLKAYEVMLQRKYYAPFSAVLGAFNTYSRYSGPREAVFTALCRKNYGCSHFVIGRDHTGVGNFFAPNASQKIFEEVGDTGITPLMFDAAYYCKACGEPSLGCSHGQQDRQELSGTEIRRTLLSGNGIPEYLVRHDVAEVLEQRVAKRLPVFEE